jgi:hypothetical protein
MGLQAAFSYVRAGERIMYWQGNVLVNIKPFPQEDGHYFARMWIKRGAELLTPPSPPYETIDEAWIVRVERLLHALGVNPDAYHLVSVPEPPEPWSGWA